MEYKVINKETKEDITNKYDWVITPNGKLYYMCYGDFICNSNATYILDVHSEHKEKVNE